MPKFRHFTYKYTRRFITGLLFVIFSFLIGLFWLFLNLSIIALLYFGGIKCLYFIKKTLTKRIVKGIFIFIFIIFVIINIKALTFDIYKIPSSSMENTLFPNDVILVNKLKYGPRLPHSPFDIPLVNIGCYFNDNARKRINQYWWPYKRLSGTSQIQQGDVMVFNSTWRKDYILVKRCVALPGEVFHIKNSRIYTNNNLYSEPEAVKKEYNFRIKNITILHKALDSFSENSILKNSRDEFSKANLTNHQLEYLKKQECIDSCSIALDTFIPKKTFAKASSLKWTFDNMGPFKVPKKGMQIILNDENFSIYKKAINSREDCEIKKINGLYYIDNVKVTSYTFKKNYYFMMGDNREGTLDSRKWGFIPEQNIIGKVQCVLYSNYQDKFQWNRFFKNVN